MLSELKELHKVANALLDKNKELKPKLDQREPLNSKMQEVNNKEKKRECFSNKPGHKRQSLKLLFLSKNKAEKMKRNWKMNVNNFYVNMHCS